MDESYELALASLRLVVESAHPRARGKLTSLDNWSTSIFSARSPNLRTREMFRQFDSAADRLASEIVMVNASVIGDDSDDDQYNLALAAIAKELNDYAYILPSEGHHFHSLAPSELVRRLLPDIQRRWDRLGLAESTSTNAQMALALCSYMIVAWSRIMPLHHSDDFWSVMLSTQRFVEYTIEKLREVKRSSLSSGGRSSRIIGAQRRDISSELGRIELFGLPVENRFRWAQIEISYLSAKVVRQPEDKGNRYPLEDLLTSIFNHEYKQQRRGSRVLLAGRAGSGKTTAAQWIAYQASQQKLASLTVAGRPLLPLFVRFRQAVRARQTPSDRELLYSNRLRDEVNINWLEECAKDCNLLIILDGWDELSTSNIPAAGKWIESLSQRFPHSHILITSRTEAVDHELFASLGFIGAFVAPLTPGDSKELARLWFAGLVSHLLLNKDIEDAVRGRDDLIRELDAPSISDMADSPLLVSMLCCLYARGKTNVPSKRGELYDLVTRALIHGRDQEREATPSPWNNYALSKKQHILGSIARAMSRDGMFRIPIVAASHSHLPSVKGVLSDVLPILGFSLGSLDEVTKGLLERSVVFHSISVNEAEFAHKSIQDYFAAYAYTQANDIDEALSKIQRSQWPMLPFACHHAVPRVSEQVISWILDRLDRADKADDGALRRMTITLAECLGAASSVSEHLRERAEQAIAPLFPPRDSDEVRSLAGLGNAIVPFLSCERAITAHRKLAIETLGRLQTREAMDALGDYACQGNVLDIESLVVAWSRFDAQSYVNHVIAQFPGELQLTITDEARLAAAGQLVAVSSLAVRNIRFKEHGPEVISNIGGIRRLELQNCQNVGSLDWTASLPALRDLIVSDCSGIETIQRLGPAELWNLRVEKIDADQIDWDQVFANLAQLRVLWLSDVPVASSVAPAEAFNIWRNLRTLALGKEAKVDSLDFLRLNLRLTKIFIGWSLTEDNMKSIGECSWLQKLSVHFHGDPAYARRLASLSSLLDLEIFGASADLLARLEPLNELRTLKIHDSDVGILTDLEIPRNVRVVSFHGCTQAGDTGAKDCARNVPVLNSVENFTWGGPNLVDLQFLYRMPYLRNLEILDCQSLRSLDGLDYVPRLEKVVIRGTPTEVDRMYILDQLRGKGCQVIHEPNYDIDFDAFFVDLGGS